MEDIFKWRKPIHADEKRSWLRKLLDFKSQRCYYLSYQLNSISIPSKFFIKLLVLVEALQLISLIMSNDRMISFNYGLPSIIKSIIRFTNFEHLQRVLGLDFTGPLVVCFLAIQILVVGLAVLLSDSKTSGRGSAREFTVRNDKKSQFLSIYCCIFQPILLMPFLVANFSMLACSVDSPYMWKYSSTNVKQKVECFSSPHVGYFVIAFISTLLSVVQLFWMFLFNKHLNPFKKDPRTSFTRIPSLISLAGKLLVAALLPLKVVYPSFVLMIPITGQFVARLLLMPSLYFELNQFSLICDSAVAWSALANLVQVAVGNSDDNPYYFWTGLIIVCTFGGTLIGRLESLVLEGSWNSPWKATRALVRLIEVVENWRVGNNQNRLDEFMAKLSHKSPAYRRFFDAEKKLFNFTRLELGMEEELVEIEDDIRHYEFVQEFANDLRRKHPKNLAISIISCYIQRERLKNNYMTFYIAHSVQAMDPGPFYDSECYSISKAIEEDFFKEDKIFGEQNGMNVTQIEAFHSLLGKFKKDLEEAGSRFHKLWSELQSGNPAISRLLTLSEFLIKSNWTLANDFGLLRQLSPNNIKTLRYYGSFKSRIQMNEVEARRFFEQAAYNAKYLAIGKNQIDDMRFRYGENTDAAMICASGNLEDFGKITSASQELVDVLGYEPQDVEGRDVNHLIPKNLAEVHTKIMQNYFLTGVSSFVNKERLIFPERADGFVSPAKGVLRIMPNLSKGLQMVVFMRPASEDELSNQRVIVTDHSGIIIGLGIGMFHLYGIQPNACYGRGRNEGAVNFNTLLPESDSSLFQELQPGEKIKTLLDTTCLRYRYYSPEEHDIQQLQKSSKENNQLGKKGANQRNEEKHEVIQEQPGLEVLDDLQDDIHAEKFKRYNVEITLHDVHVLGKVRHWRIYLVNPIQEREEDHIKLMSTNELDEIPSDAYLPELIPVISHSDIRKTSSIVNEFDAQENDQNKVLEKSNTLTVKRESPKLPRHEQRKKAQPSSKSKIKDLQPGLSRRASDVSSLSNSRNQDMSFQTGPGTNQKPAGYETVREEKTFLSNKQMPKVIYFMMISLVVGAFVLFVIAVASIGRQHQWSNNFVTLIDRAVPSYRLMSKILTGTLNAYRIHFISAGQISESPSITFNGQVNSINNLILSALEDTKSLTSLPNALKAMGLPEPPNQTMTTVRPLSNNQFNYYQDHVIFSVSEFINRLRVLSNLTGPDPLMLQPLSNFNLLNGAFFFIVNNTLQNYRVAFQSLDNFLTVEARNALTFNSYFEYICLPFTVLVLSLYLMIKIFRVLSVQNKVLDIIGLMNPEELSYLVNNCNAFLIQIEESSMLANESKVHKYESIKSVQKNEKAKSNRQIGIENNENEPFISTDRKRLISNRTGLMNYQNERDIPGVKTEIAEIKDVSPLVHKNEQKRLSQNQKQASHNKSAKSERSGKLQEIENEETVNTQGLSLQSKSISQKMFMSFLWKFSFLVIVILGMIGAKLGVELKQYAQARQSLILLGDLFRISSDLQLAEVLLYSEAYRGNQGKQGLEATLAQEISNKFYQDNLNLQSLSTISFSSSMSDFSNYLKRLSVEFCKQPEGLYTEECRLVALNNLPSSMSTSISSMSATFSSMQTKLSLQSNALSSSWFSDTDLFGVQVRWLGLALGLIEGAFLQAIQYQASLWKTQSDATTSAFIILTILFCSLGIWVSANKVKEQVWISKGLLNLIPTTVIIRNEQLKAAFVSRKDLEVLI